jgi:hypothetical protein
MHTSAASVVAEAAATRVRFEGDRLTISLDDGRELSLDLDRIPWLRWLREAPPEQRGRWQVEPGGFAVYWPDLDDGLEVRHVLSLGRIA